MSAVVEAVVGAVSDVVEFVGDVGETVVQAAGDVVETVGDVAENVVQGAVQDPLGTIAKVGTAIYAPYLLPVVTAADVVAKGGDIEDALVAGAVSWAVPEVGEFIGGEIAGSAVGDFLNEAAQTTGIAALPQAATRGIAQTVAGTASGLAQGQDLEDALTRGLTSGIGSTVGRIAGSEIDTGSQIADRLIGQTIGGGTTAALRGRDFETGAGGALASGLLDVGLSEGIKALKEPSAPATTKVAETQFEPEEFAPPSDEYAPPPQLASSGATATDVSRTPTEELISQLRPSVTVYDPATGLPVQTQASAEDDANLKALVEALYPTEREEEAPYSPEKIEVARNARQVDEYGNLYDISGALIGDAEDFGLSRGTDAMGNTTWITPTGESIVAAPASPFTFESQIEAIGSAPSVSPIPSYDAAPDATALDVGSLLGSGEMEGDYPERIVNNPDGSTTVFEFDGTQRIFNVDGTVTTISPDTEEEPLDEFPREPLEETPEEASSPLNLGNLAGALLDIGSGGSSTRTVRGGRTVRNAGFPFGALAAGAAGIAAGLSNEGVPDVSMGGVNPYGFDWRTGQYMAPRNAVAYGQRFVNPEYNPVTTAAEGGLMSVAPQYIQPTVPNNGLTFKQPVDPTSSVYMYAQGGLSSLGHYSDGGRMLKGPGDGMSDDIPATIAGRQPARLANEEFVIPADVVSHLGNGSSEAGAKVLYDMMARVRKARTGTTRQGKQIKPQKYLPK